MTLESSLTTHTILYGTEPFRVERALLATRKKVVNEQFGALGHKVLREPRLSEVIEVLGTVSFALGGKTCIEIHNPECFSAAFENERDLKALKESIEMVDGNAKHIIWVSKKLDSRLSFSKWILGRDDVESFKFEALKFYQTKEAAQFLFREAEYLGIPLEERAADALVASWGVDLRVLTSELGRLALYTKGDPITLAVVNQLSHHSDNLFKVVDSLMTGRLSVLDVEALVSSHLVRHPSETFSMFQGYLGNYFRTAYLFHQGCSPDSIAQQTGQKPYTVKKQLESLRGVSLPHLKALRHKLLQLEWKAKTGQMESHLALELVLGK